MLDFQMLDLRMLDFRILGRRIPGPRIPGLRILRIDDVRSGINVELLMTSGKAQPFLGTMEKRPWSRPSWVITAGLL
jgi:hypothetical protein